jgi:hypothetical protein
VSGYPLQFQQQHLFILHTARASEDGLDGGVDGFHHTKADMVIAVGRDPLDMLEEEVAQALHLRQSLPT